MILRIAKALGVPVEAIAWAAYALAVIGSATVSGVLVHSYDSAQHRAAVADLRAEAATTLADQTATVLGLLQDKIDANAKLEEEAAHAAEDRARLAAEGARLSADLAAAGQRLLDLARSGGRGGGGAPGQGDAGTDGCAAVRTALGRAAAALELYKSEGDQAAADGQRGVDAATIAAREARLREGTRE